MAGEQAPLITAQELRDALGRNTYMALFDEDDEGQSTGDVATVDVSRPVLLTLARAHARVRSRLAAVWTQIPKSTDPQIPLLLKDAELNFAIGMAYDRHPEYVNRFGWDPVRKGAYQIATDTMELIQDAVLRVDDPSPGTPVNVGGTVIDNGNRVFLPNPDGTNNSGDW